MNNSSKDSKVLPNLFWIFRRKKYESKETFSEAIKQYQIDISGEDVWRSDEIVIDQPEIKILLEKDWEMPPEDKIEFTLESGNFAHFTALDLMFELNNTLTEYDLGDYQFFEGLKYIRERKIFLINLGS